MRRLAHLSDLHFGRVDPAAVEGLVRSLEAARPDLVVVSGDLTQSARTREFRAARAFLDRLPAPTFAVPGNHDLPQWDPVERLVRPYDRYRRFIAQELEPVWSDAELAIVGMKSPRRLPRNLNRAAGRVERAPARARARAPRRPAAGAGAHRRRAPPALAARGPAAPPLAGPRLHARGGAGARGLRPAPRTAWCCPATSTCPTRAGTSPSPRARGRRRWRCRRRGRPRSRPRCCRRPRAR